MKNTPILITDPHGEHVLRPLGGDESLPVGSRLFFLRNGAGKGPGNICLTGEELDSLAAQWQKYRKKNK